MVTVVFPVFFAKVIADGREDADFLFGTAFSLSQWLVLLTAPLVGALADIYAAKKKLLILSTLMCVIPTILLGFSPNIIWIALTLFIIATVAYSAGENIVAGFLPELSTPENIGRISGISWGIGYCGGLLCLLLINFIISSHLSIGGLSAMHLSFIATGLFFGISSLPTFLFLKERKTPESLAPGDHVITYAFRKIKMTLAGARENPRLWKFLGVFFIYSCGISTVITFAAIYAVNEIGYTQGEIIRLFIALQISSTIGAFGFGWLQDKIGARITIQISLIFWIITIIGAWLSQDKTQFFVVANIAGLCIGGSQCTSRAFIGQLAPSNRPGESFGYWGFFARLAAAVGPFCYGVVSSATGSGRLAILFTGIFFVAGWIGMFFIRDRGGQGEKSAS